MCEGERQQTKTFLAVNLRYTICRSCADKSIEVAPPSESENTMTSIETSWLHIAASSEPLERFIDAFIDECANEKSRRRRKRAVRGAPTATTALTAATSACYGCGANIACFVRRLLDRTQYFADKLRTNNVDDAPKLSAAAEATANTQTVQMLHDDEIFFPQNWYADLRNSHNTAQRFQCAQHFFFAGDAHSNGISMCTSCCATQKTTRPHFGRNFSTSYTPVHLIRASTLTPSSTLTKQTLRQHNVLCAQDLRRVKTRRLPARSSSRSASLGAKLNASNSTSKYEATQVYSSRLFKSTIMIMSFLATRCLDISPNYLHSYFFLADLIIKFVYKYNFGVRLFNGLNSSPIYYHSEKSTHTRELHSYLLS